MGSKRIDAPWTIRPAQHTVLGDTYDVVEWFEDEATTGAIVARVHPSVRGIQGKEESMPEVRKRALKMAAAPEMFAALEELVARRDERTAGTSRADGKDGRYARARAALAKAMGK